MADSDMGRFVMEPEDIHWLTLCPTCVHIYEGCEAVCKAFPGGIPERFIGGVEEHRTPVEGDGGVVYAPREQAGL